MITLRLVLSLAGDAAGLLAQVAVALAATEMLMGLNAGRKP